MIKHIALFRLKQEHGGMDKALIAKQIFANVDGLRKAIPSIRRIEAGSPLDVPGVNFPQSDVAVMAEFDSKADYAAYFLHPKHREAAAFAASVSESIAGITYEA